MTFGIQCKQFKNASFLSSRSLKRLNFGFSFFEFNFGKKSNSMGLISDAVHLFFDSLAILIALAGIIFPIRQKLLRTRWRMFLADDALK